MLVADSFDLWQKDTFFSAAEEVQQSADIMESAYRTWFRARREGTVPQHLNELERELQMALGTAKWQLEEFERAVCQSHRNNGDDITVTRHRQFVSAIEDQISGVETALKESFDVDGKRSFRWVNLDEQECDDLAHFLSGTPGTSQMIKAEHNKSNIKESFCFDSELSSKVQMSNPEESSGEILTSVKTGDEISYEADQATSNRRTWSSPDRIALEIVIDRDDRQMIESVEATPKEKGSKPFFWRSSGESMINWISQHLRGGHGSHRQHVSPVLPVRSIRFLLAFMLTIFLVGYSFALGDGKAVSH